MLNKKKKKGFFNVFKTEGDIVELEVWGGKATSKSKLGLFCIFFLVFLLIIFKNLWMEASRCHGAYKQVLLDIPRQSFI